MASSIPPPPSSKESLGQRISTAAHIIVSNSWAAKHEVDHAVAKALTGNFDHMGIGRFMVEQQILSRDQASELEEVLKHQGHFPGYRLRRKIGSGGMGTVFLADHLATNRQVALKTMNARLEEDRDFVGRFQREAKALASVDHPNIAQIIDSGQAGPHCWLAMEFIDGPSLMSLLKDYRVLPEVYALRITRQIAEGLGHVWKTAHLVHRDIKPENILVLRNRTTGGDLFPADDCAKLIDFGLVKGEDKDERLTQTGMTIGTPLYMSPEQVRGDKLDCRSDIYGLGATLYHLLTGFTPFTGTSPGSIMSAHLTEKIPDPGDRVPSLTKATRDLVMMAMAKEADQRFLVCEALVKAIDDALKAANAKGGGTLRLLRKPLVLNKPTAKKPASSERPPPKEESALAPKVPSTDLIAKRKTTSSPNLPPPPPSPERMSGAQALARVHTDRITAAKTGAPPPPPPPPPPALDPLPSKAKAEAQSANRVDASRVFDEDPKAHMHMGILPWVVLAFAVVGLLVWLVVSRF